MKKMLFLLAFISITVVAYNQLEKAIIETDLAEVEAALLSTGSLTEEEKLICLSLSQQKIDEMNNRLLLDSFLPFCNSAYWWLGLTGVLSSMAGILICSEEYSYRRHGIAPIAGLISLMVATYVCLKRSSSEESRYQALIQQSSLDAYKIKQRVLNY